MVTFANAARAWFGGLALTIGATTAACSGDGTPDASASDQGLTESSLSLACEVHYFDAATTLNIFNAAKGKAAVSSLEQTPLVLTTPEGVTASITVIAASKTLTVEVTQGGARLGDGSYVLTSDPSFATDLQRPMPPVVKAGLTYDSVWVGCFPTQSVAPSLPPNADRRELQAQSIDSYVDALAPFTAWHDPVDADAVKARERTIILQGDGSDAVFFGAAWRTLNAFPQGHQHLESPDASVCGKALPFADTSRFGVCGRPSSTGLVVTRANPGNKLGLSAGDVIVDAGGDTGEAIFTKAYERPMCSDVFPAPSGRRAAGAASFFGSLPAGMKLTVAPRAGGQRMLLVPADGDAELTECTDLFGRDRRIYAEANVRADGVAVIRLPSFFPFDKAFPANATQADVDAMQAAYQAEIQRVFDTVKSAPGIIWDARGNTGGFTAVALAIVSGFPAAKATQLSYCQTRVASSNPPAYDGPRYAEYAITPGGPFAYAGKVAVVTDGLAYSAGDYFPFAAMKGGNAIVVGSPTAGAFGGGDSPIDIAGPPALSSNYDPTACFDATTGKPLEGTPLSPTVEVDVDPQDVATAKDTVIERAVKELGF